MRAHFIGGLVKSPFADIINANLYGASLNADSTIRSAQEITTAVNKGTIAIQEGLDKVVMSNIIGNIADTLITSGTIAVSTAILSGKLEKIYSGLERLGAQFTEGLSLIVAKFDLQNNLLTEMVNNLDQILSILKSPLTTQAVELRNIGLDRMQKGLWPEALNSFNKSLEKDETDPISNYMIGKIYLDAVSDEFNFHNPEKALYYFSKAVRYSHAFSEQIPKFLSIYKESLYFQTLALMINSSVLNKKGDIDNAKIYLKDAEKSINTLLNCDEDNTQARYLKVKILLIQGDYDNCLKEMQILVQKDSQFASTALVDEDFTQYSPIGMKIIYEIEKTVREIINNEVDIISEKYKELTEMELNIDDEIKNILSKYGCHIETLKEDIKGIDYFKIIDPSCPLHSLLKIVNNMLSEQIEREKVNFQNELTGYSDKIKEKLFLVNRKYCDEKWPEFQLLVSKRSLLENPINLNHLKDYFIIKKELEEIEKKIEPLDKKSKLAEETAIKIAREKVLENKRRKKEREYRIFKVFSIIIGIIIVVIVMFFVFVSWLVYQ